MATYKLVKALIDAGRTTGIADKLGVLWLGGSITEEQYTELVLMLPVEGE